LVDSYRQAEDVLAKEENLNLMGEVEEEESD